jgi:tocopherol O-methyltransferase
MAIFPSQPQNIHSIASHYNDIDPFYRKIWGEHLHHGLWKTGREESSEAVNQLVKLIAEQGAVKPGDKVCDIGCGYGATARMLAEENGATVTGLTVSEAQYQYIQKHYFPSHNPIYLLQNWEENQFPDESFDTVLSIESSEHMIDKLKFFSEIFRVLRPGGRLVICAWLASEDPKNWEIQHLLEPICSEGRLPSLGSEKEYRGFFEQAGFKKLDFQDLTAKVKKTWLICIKRFLQSFLQDRETRDFLFKSTSENKGFLKAVFRMWAAYQVGSLRYGIFTARK